MRVWCEWAYLNHPNQNMVFQNACPAHFAIPTELNSQIHLCNTMEPVYFSIYRQCVIKYECFFSPTVTVLNFKLFSKVNQALKAV